MNDVYVGLGLAVLGAGVVLFFMNKAQKKREKDADAQFELTLMSHGMKNEIEERPKIDPFAKIATRADVEQEIEVRDVSNEDAVKVLGKVTRIKAKPIKKKSKKKSTNKRGNK